MIQTVEKIYTSTGFNYLMTLTDDSSWSVPNDPENTDYQAIQEWIADGGVVIDNGGSE
jgi:hypothetical protein